MESNPIQKQIEVAVQAGLSKLRPSIKQWVQTHLVHPRLISLSLDPDASSFKEVWLVTDHTGEQDSSYRIVYDSDSELFGLECTLESGVEWYMGNYGSFSQTVESM
jgi:hypothetical protein